MSRSFTAAKCRLVAPRSPAALTLTGGSGECAHEIDPPSVIHRFAHAIIDAHLLEKLLDDEIDVSH